MRNSGRPVTPPTTGGVLVGAPDADRPLEDLVGLDEPVEAALLPPDECVPAPLTGSELLAWAVDDPSFGGAACLVETVDPAGLDELERVRYLELANRLERQAAAMRLRAVAALAGPEPAASQWRRREFTDCEVAAALQLSPPAGARQVHAARQLTTHLPATMRALGRGEIGYLQALTITEATYRLDAALLPRVEELVLAKAVGASPGQTRALVRKTVARVAPDLLAEREADARRAAEVSVRHGEDGTAQVCADHVPSADAAVIEAALDGYARSRKARGDERTLGQLEPVKISVCDGAI